jgi:SAM-dependent methyltransferase
VASNPDSELADVRAQVERWDRTAAPATPAVDPDTLPRFSEHVSTELTPDERDRLAREAERLEPWLQGPFLLGGDLVVGGAWRNDQRWVGLGERVPADLSGRRVLDVGSNAGYDPFMFNLRGAEYVLACEPFGFYHQAVFLESIYRTGIDFRQIPWQALSVEEHGRFDLIHCHGVLYHELQPVVLLERLHELLGPDGELFFGSMMLADEELSEYARFVPADFAGDETWWWVPGRLTMRWLLEVTGFDIRHIHEVHPGPRGEFAVVNGYFEAARGERPPITAPPPSAAPAG